MHGNLVLKKIDVHSKDFFESQSCSSCPNVNYRFAALKGESERDRGFLEKT